MASDMKVPWKKRREVSNLTLPFALVMLLLSPQAAAGEETSWKLDISLSTIYDDNILRYSDKYISRFYNREDEGRFHINTRDDMIVVSALRMSATMKLFGGLKTIGSLEFRRRMYMHNPIKDWSFISLTLRQELSEQFAAQIGYNYIPAFYVRHYRDENWVKEYGYTPNTFQPFGFTKDEATGWVQYAVFINTRVKAIVSFERYFYNEHFTEYDATNTSFGIEVIQVLSKTFTLTGDIGVVYSHGKGNEIMDPSYHETNCGFSAELDLPKLFGRTNSIELGGEYARRSFTSRHFLELDPYHAGRWDDTYRVSIKYTYKLMKDLTLAFSYAYHRRDARTSATPNAEYLAEEKDYRQYQIGLDIRYTMSLFSSK